MKKLFIHNPLFRLLSPFASGAMVYILILLINNNIGQIRETFFGQELYVCIGLAFLIQEYARVSLVLFDRFKYPSSIFWRIIVQIIGSVLVTILIVTIAMKLYFGYFLGYTPNTKELLIFNSIFTFITLIYVMLYMGHQFLYKINIEKLEEESLAIQDLDADFVAYKNEINIKLLFESLEALIILMKKDPDAAEEFTDKFSSIYRYTLSSNKKDLLPITEEVKKVEELLDLFADLPFRKIKLENAITSDFQIVPGSLLRIFERIIRTSIRAEDHHLTININESETHLQIRYRHNEMLNNTLTFSRFEDIINQYTFYTQLAVNLTEQDGIKIIQLPKLYIHEGSYN